MAEILEARRTLARLRAPLMSAAPLAAIRDACLDRAQLRRLQLALAAEETVKIDGEMDDEQIQKELDAIDHPERRQLLAIVAAVSREIDARALQRGLLYPAHTIIRNFFGSMTRKLSVTSSQ